MKALQNNIYSAEIIFDNFGITIDSELSLYNLCGK